LSDKLYKVLGVAKGASDEEIRKAYRKLAKDLHPDLHPGDAKAEERFKEVSAAHAILGDADKRAAYDRGEIDDSGAERQQHTYYRRYADSDQGHHYHTTEGFQDFSDIGDIFSDLFSRGGGRAATGGTDVRYRLKVDFLEAALGEKKRIYMPDGAALDVAIPRGVSDGQMIRLKGKGHAGPQGTPPGDALVEIEVGTHPFFTRQDLDVHMDLPITIDEAVLGGKVEVPTIDGTVAMSVPKGASSGRIMRLKGRGISPRGGKKAGDQLVKLVIVMPPNVDDELETFMSKWKADHAYNPRKTMKVSA